MNAEEFEQSIEDKRELFKEKASSDRAWFMKELEDEMDGYPVKESLLLDSAARELSWLHHGREGMKFNPRYLLAMVKEIIETRPLLARFKRLFLDKPEDRLYHASDRTWWRRIDDHPLLGEATLVRADAPGDIVDLYEVAVTLLNSIEQKHEAAKMRAVNKAISLARTWWKERRKMSGKEKVVKQGYISIRHGTAVMEAKESDPELGEFTTGTPVIPYDMRGKYVRITIEELEEPS